MAPSARSESSERIHCLTPRLAHPLRFGVSVAVHPCIGSSRYDSVMPKFRPRHLLLTAAIMCCAAGSAWAQSWPPGGGNVQAPRGDFDRGDTRGARNDAADAVRRAQAESGGRVLGAERVQFDGRDIMRVKVMDENGRVRYMDDDPSTRSGQARGAGSERNGMQAQRPHGANPQRP